MLQKNFGKAPATLETVGLFLCVGVHGCQSTVNDINVGNQTSETQSTAMLVLAILLLPLFYVVCVKS
jgi:hypothetical protein